MSSADKVFEALASVTRRRILAYISEAPLSAGEIAARFEMSQPAVSKHLAILEGAGLVWKRREGMNVFYG
ncbi:MAG: metalloregulator ArsR/SmtB family transcription factor, partial [Cereibacter sp.]